MKIAIIEDTKEDRLWLSEKLENFMKHHHLHFTLYQYTCAEDFMKEIDTIHFDIVFMDIYLPEMSGMDAAKYLRKKDKDCKLVFLTVSEDYLRQGYSVNACHYLIKPASDEDFLEAMDNCRIKVQYAVPYLDFVSNKMNIHLDTSQICYMNLQGRTVYVHTPSETFPVNSTFRSLTEPLLADKRFFSCLQGIMVNMDYISGYKENVFILKNGETIPFNIRNRKQILQQYRNYIFENMGKLS